MANETKTEENSPRISWKGVVLGMVLTIVALFGMQEWYHTYSMVTAPSLTRVGEQPAAYEAARRQELESGPMPIVRAMQMLADRGRTASPSITPQASTEPGPAAGWLHHPGYEAPPLAGEGLPRHPEYDAEEETDGDPSTAEAASSAEAPPTGEAPLEAEAPPSADSPNPAQPAPPAQ